MTAKTMTKLGLVAGLLIGCAATPPKELVDARAAYRAAAEGEAAQYNPAELHTAQKALTIAEKTYEDEGDNPRTRDRAYIALRRAQLAETQAKGMRAENELASLEQQRNSSNAQELAAARDALQNQRTELESERQRREEAERRAKQASEDLARVATVKQDARGMVITLSGSVLFASGKSELLPAAQARLSEVARALSEQSGDANIVVEGHTDSQGSESFNLDLSEKRAEAVRSYLTSHGVASDRIRAEGIGMARPVADNKTAEGRANNRRVEIVVQPSSGEGGGGAPGATPPGGGASGTQPSSPSG